MFQKNDNNKYVNLQNQDELRKRVVTAKENKNTDEEQNSSRNYFNESEKKTKRLRTFEKDFHNYDSIKKDTGSSDVLKNELADGKRKQLFFFKFIQRHELLKKTLVYFF